MTINYVLYKNAKEVQAACEIAIKNRLYVAGWTLRPALELIKSNKVIAANSKIALAFLDEEPIGLAVVQYSTIAVFIRAAHRRQGIGTHLLSLLKKSMPENQFSLVTASLGVDGSNLFWRANEVSYIIVSAPSH